MITLPRRLRGRWLAAPLVSFSLLSLSAACSSSTDAAHSASTETHAGLTTGTDYDVERYDIHAELDWTRNRLVATTEITVRPHGLETLSLDSAVDVKAVRGTHGKPLPFTVDAKHRKLHVDVSRAPRGHARLRLEIDYEAQAEFTGDSSGRQGFFMQPALKGDPAASRVAFTFSEPFAAPSWMPCHDTPSDRAVFSMEMRLPANEKLLANGNLMFDREDKATNSHTVKYDSDFTLSTYVMAFDVGEFDVEKARTSSGFPLSIWHRRGIPNDYRTALAESARTMDAFERLVGPYPFQSYAQVFVPGSSGIENVTISSLGEAYLDYSLYNSISIAGHELAHHWFGNLVTNDSFYDVSFKEGMATLLEMESMRVYLDEGNVGTLGSERRDPKDGDPIVRDRAIPPFPYGKGPYARASWLLSQIRYFIGDEAFWSTLRHVLRKHRFGTIGTNAFVDAFAPRLGTDATARVRRALVAKRLPRLRVEPAAGGAFVTVSDVEGSLVTPLTVRWVSPDGTTRDQELAVDARVELTRRTADEFLVVDPLDIHPDAKRLAALDSAQSGKNYEANIVPLLVPKSTYATAQWLRVGGVHHTALLSRTLPPISPDAFESFVKKLGAEGAKMLAIQRACEVASDPKLDPNVRAAWSAVLARTLSKTPHSVGLRDAGGKRFAACGKVVDIEGLFASEWSQLESGLPENGLPENRVVFLSQFDLGPERQWSVWTNVAKRSGSLNQRETAVGALSDYASNALVPEADIPSWRAFFVDLLSHVQNYLVLEAAIRGAIAIKADTLAGNADLLSGLNAVLHDPIDYWYGFVHTDALCGAYAVIGDPASPAWQRFVSRLSDANLKPDIRAYVDDPSLCGAFF